MPNDNHTPTADRDGHVCSTAELGAWQPIETAPRDGTTVGIWSPRDPGTVKLAKWAHHLGSESQPMAWCSTTRGIALTNLPTHWVRLKAPNAQ